MIGVTVVTPSYKHLEKEAVARFKKHTGVKKVKVIRCKDTEGFTTKLKLDQLCPKEPVCFFDVDLWFVRDVQLPTGATFAVHDPSVHIPHTFPNQDCETFGLDPMQYFNSGLLIWDNRKTDLFRLARLRHKDKKAAKPVDWTDQFYLNYAAQRGRIPISFLPFSFNMYPKCIQHGGFPYYPRLPIVVHAAGFRLKDKHKALKAMALIFGEEGSPMQQSAVNLTHALSYELR